MRLITNILPGSPCWSTSANRLLLCLALTALPTMAPGQTPPWRPNPLVRFWDLRVNPLEFRTPVLLVPFDVKGSLTVYGGPDMFQAFLLSRFRGDQSAVVLDSTESEINPSGPSFPD